jgi:hypothetical protein
MLVPEAAMNNDRLLAAHEGKVGRARQVAAALPIADSKRLHGMPDENFGLGRRLANLRHPPAHPVRHDREGCARALQET